MPVEMRGTIELRDITAVEFRCMKCGHATMLPLKDSENFKLPKLSDCESHIQSDIGAHGEDVSNFFRKLAAFAAKERPYSIRLHVEGLNLASPSAPALGKPKAA